jgi:hypothetical protein
MTPGKGFRAQDDHRQAGERRQERAAYAKDDHGAPGQQERGRDVGPYAQHPLAGADRGHVRQGPVVQVRVRVLRHQAEHGRTGQRLALIGERTMAQPDLFDGGLQSGEAGVVGCHPDVA